MIDAKAFIDSLTPTWRLRVAGAAVVAIAVLLILLGARSWWLGHQVLIHEQQAGQLHVVADQDHAQADTAKGEGDHHAQNAGQLQHQLQTEQPAVDSLRARWERDRAAFPAHRPEPGPEAVPNSVPPSDDRGDPPIALPVLAADAEAYIAALEHKASMLEAVVAELRAADTAHQAEAAARAREAEALRAEAVQLRAALDAAKRQPAWATGILIETDGSRGAWVERQWQVIQAGLQVKQRPLNGNRETVIGASFGLRF